MKCNLVLYAFIRISLNNKTFAFSTLLRSFPANCAWVTPWGRCTRHLKAPEYLKAHSSRFRVVFPVLLLLFLCRARSQAFSFLLSHIKFTKIVLTPFKLTSMCWSAFQASLAALRWLLIYPWPGVHDLCWYGQALADQSHANRKENKKKYNDDDGDDDDMIRT